MDTFKKSAQYIELKIYDLSGKQVRNLVSKKENAGNYKVRWDGKDDKGIDVTSGIYFSQMTTNSFSQIKRMLLLR